MNVPVLHCLRCHHTWHPRSAKLPTKCPNKCCGSKHWNKRHVVLDRVTKEALLQMVECKMKICNELAEDYKRELGYFDIDRPARPSCSNPDVVPYKERRRTHEVTYENLPDDFKRITQ